ncbi:MAG: hypothetical protein ACOZE5_09165 [Verrucomicrobiota bacterium]
MLLDATKVSDLFRLLSSSQSNGLEKVRGASVSLTAAVSLALFHQRQLSTDGACAQLLEQLSLPGVGTAIRALAANVPTRSADPFGAPAFELYRIRSRADVASDEWTLFYDRFRRSATDRRKSDMFRSVGGVLGEIGDNVPAHAYADPGIPCSAMAGFHVADGVATFCVCDLGQGFLASLRRKREWGGLRSEHDALDAVVNRQATSREGETEGGGFKQLFNMLLDFNGLVILRSGNCMFLLTNEGHARRLQARSGAEVPGSSVTVVISQANAPQEIALPEIA